MIKYSIIAMALLLLAQQGIANQVGINFSQDAIGALGDYQKAFEVLDAEGEIIKAYELELDAQAQKSVSFSLASHVSLNVPLNETVGIKPFAAYNRDTIGNTLDAGGLINFSVGALDIAAGASFRGANPTATALEKRFDANGIEVEVHTAGYSPNAYQLPAINNVNAVLQTGFERWDVETDLTAYVPITERGIVPVVLISRSQTSVDLAENLSLSVVVDARTYLHKNGAEVSFKPLGAVTYKF